MNEPILMPITVSSLLHEGMKCSTWGVRRSFWTYADFYFFNILINKD